MDVERTLGEPYQNLDNQQLTYRFPDVVVVFYFTSNPKCREKLPYTSWDVTAQTVTGIEVNLRDPPLVSEIGIDLTKFKKVKGDFDLVGRYHYLNDEYSFGVEVDDKHVAGYHYSPGSKYENLRCEPAKTGVIGAIFPFLHGPPSVTYSVHARVNSHWIAHQFK